MHPLKYVEKNQIKEGRGQKTHKKIGIIYGRFLTKVGPVRL